MTKPAPSTEENPGRILAAARQLILEQGIGALSVRKLAEASGLALRTIYNLYGNKESVLIALFETGTRALDLAMDRLEAAMTRSPWKTEFYLEWIDQVESMLLENQALIKPALIAGFSPLPPPQAIRIHQRRIRRLKDALVLAARQDLIWADLDLDVCARLIYTNYFNVVAEWARGDIDDHTLIVHGRYAILTILHTLINAPDRRENALNLLRALTEEK